MKKSFYTILVIAVIALTMGCHRHINERNTVSSLGEPPPVPEQLQLIVNDQAVLLSWTVSDMTGVSFFRVYMQTDGAGEFVERTTTAGMVTTITGLLDNHSYAFLVRSVTADALEGEPSVTVSTQITPMSITINDDQEFVRGRNVLVQINAPANLSNLMISEDSLFVGEEFGLFAGNQTAFQLSDGDGTKTVYARFQFSDGAQTGDLLSDDIILDRLAEIESLIFDFPDSTFGPGDTIRFALRPGEAGGTAIASFGGINNVSLLDEDGDSVYTGEWIVPTLMNLTNGPVTGRFTDAAGNGPVMRNSDYVLNIASPPAPVNLAAAARPSTDIELTWSQTTSTDFSSYQIFRSVSSSVDNQSPLVELFTSRTTTSWKDTTVTAGTTYYYRLYVFNLSGLNAGSNVASANTITNAPTAPEDGLNKTESIIK